MKFENTPKGDGGSYERPKEGKYIGLLVGFCYVGTHGGGQYGPKEKVLLRWELHKRRAPSLDSKGFPHTLTALYGATVRGENSLLRKALEAHGIDLPEGAETDSRDWLGYAAWLDVELSRDGKWANLEGVSRLDPDEDAIPASKLRPEHWEGEQDGAPPAWAHWALRRSQDLARLVPGSGSNGEAQPAGAGAGAGAAADDDSEIPF